MAVYEYKCSKCGSITTKEFPISGSVDWVFCDRCRKGKAKKIISVSNFRVKGFSEKNNYSRSDK